MGKTKINKTPYHWLWLFLTVLCFPPAMHAQRAHSTNTETGQRSQVSFLPDDARGRDEDVRRCADVLRAGNVTQNLRGNGRFTGIVKGVNSCLIQMRWFIICCTTFFMKILAMSLDRIFSYFLSVLNKKRKVRCTSWMTSWLSVLVSHWKGLGKTLWMFTFVIHR